MYTEIKPSSLNLIWVLVGVNTNHKTMVFLLIFELQVAWNLYKILWLSAIANNKNHASRYLPCILEQHILQNETVRSVILWGASILTRQRQASMMHNIYILLQVIPQTLTT